jgi:prepilin-type N-terminal cleavage/methylation domain-containing protein
MRSIESQQAPSQGGFTLLELLVSLAIFSIVTGTIYALLHVASSDRFTTNQRSEILQNARVAVATIGLDIQNAGYSFDRAIVPDDSLTFVGLPADADADEDRLFPIVPGNGLRINELSGAATDVVSFASIDDGWNVDANGNAQPLPIDDINGGNQLRTPLTDGMAAAREGELYVVSDDKSDTIGWCTRVPGPQKANFANNDPLGINRPGASGALFQKTLPCTMTKLRWVSYWVESDGTLVRAVMGDPALLVGSGGAEPASRGFLVMPVANGVEDFQVDYVVAEDGATLVTENPRAAQIPGIRQVRITVRMRSADRDPRTRDFYRTTLTSTFSARNLGFTVR